MEKEDVVARVERELGAAEPAPRGVWKLDETQKRNFLIVLRFLLTENEQRTFVEILDLIDVVSFFQDVRMRTAVEVVVTDVWVCDQRDNILSGGKF